MLVTQHDTLLSRKALRPKDSPHRDRRVAARPPNDALMEVRELRVDILSSEIKMSAYLAIARSGAQL